MRAHALVSACVRMHLDPREFVCVRLRACSRAGLIKTLNVFAREKSQNSNALWVQKLSGCSIYISSCTYISPAILIYLLLYLNNSGCIYIPQAVFIYISQVLHNFDTNGAPEF